MLNNIIMDIGQGPIEEEGHRPDLDIQKKVLSSPGKHMLSSVSARHTG